MWRLLWALLGDWWCSSLLGGEVCLLVVVGGGGCGGDERGRKGYSLVARWLFEGAGGGGGVVSSFQRCEYVAFVVVQAMVYQLRPATASASPQRTGVPRPASRSLHHLQHYHNSLYGPSKGTELPLQMVLINRIYISPTQPTRSKRCGRTGETAACSISVYINEILTRSHHRKL